MENASEKMLSVCNILKLAIVSSASKIMLSLKEFALSRILTVLSILKMVAATNARINIMFHLIWSVFQNSPVACTKKENAHIVITHSNSTNPLKNAE